MDGHFSVKGVLIVRLANFARHSARTSRSLGLLRLNALDHRVNTVVEIRNGISSPGFATGPVFVVAALYVLKDFMANASSSFTSKTV